MSELRPLKRKFTQRQLLICCVFLLIANISLVLLLAVGVISHRLELHQQRSELSEQLGIHEGMDEAQLQEQYAIALGEANRQVYLHSEVTVEDNMVPLWLSNGEESTCAVSVTLELVSSAEVIAQSRPINPGWHLESLDLEKALPPGQYHCFARCVFYTMEEDLLLGETVRQVLLTVE